MRLLSDVTAPLLGPEGAAAVFGPQKGATPDDVRTLEAALARFAAAARRGRSDPGAGAAGGAGYGFLAAWGATIESGARAIATLPGWARSRIRRRPRHRRGTFDATSITGKVVGSRARARRARSAVIAGQLAADPPGPGCSLTELAGSAEAALADPGRWLREAGAPRRPPLS